MGLCVPLSATPPDHDGRGRRVEANGDRLDLSQPFSGHALNAVDAKGRVSVPHSFRQMIERRCRALPNDGTPPPENLLKIGEHKDGKRLQALDFAAERIFNQQFRDGVADLPAAERMDALETATADFFGAFTDCTFDGAGRMVLPPLLRAIGGIEDLALFWGAGQTIQIWNPVAAFHAFEGNPRNQRVVQFLLKERGVAL